MKNPVFELSGISKTYRVKGQPEIHAVHDLSLQLSQGEIYGFLGQNGAGKTTTVRCALGLIPVDAGEVFFFGSPPKDRHKTFAQIGFCPDHFSFPPELTVRENLLSVARLHRFDSLTAEKQTEKWIEQTGLFEIADRQAGLLSLGNKQRLMIAQALIGEPKLLFLDEPTQGLDPLGVKALRGLLRKLADQGTTIFLNSHQLSVVEKICDRIGILHKGRLVRQDTLDELVKTGDVERHFIDVVKGS